MRPQASWIARRLDHFRPSQPSRAQRQRGFLARQASQGRTRLRAIFLVVAVEVASVILKPMLAVVRQISGRATHLARSWLPLNAIDHVRFRRSSGHRANPREMSACDPSRHFGWHLRQINAASQVVIKRWLRPNEPTKSFPVARSGLLGTPCLAHLTKR